MKALINAGPDQLVRGPVDPSKGNLFGILGDLPVLSDRIKQGGPVGAVIMVLLAIGLVIGVYKIFTLTTMGSAMRKTAKTRQAGDAIRWLACSKPTSRTAVQTSKRWSSSSTNRSFVNRRASNASTTS